MIEEVRRSTRSADFFSVTDRRPVGEPILNLVTEAEHRARIEMPEGGEFRIAEAGSGTTRTTGQILLPDLENTHAQFARIHFSKKASSISNPPLSARAVMTDHAARPSLLDAPAKVG